MQRLLTVEGWTGKGCSQDGMTLRLHGEDVLERLLCTLGFCVLLVCVFLCVNICVR